MFRSHETDGVPVPVPDGASNVTSTSPEGRDETKNHPVERDS